MSSSDTRRTSWAYRATQRFLGAAICFLLMASSSYAQAATPSSKLGFDEAGWSVATAQSAVYTPIVDGVTLPAFVASTVVCTATTSPAGATCTVPLPALTIGPHTMTLTENISGVTSPQSAPLTFSFVVVVVPTNLRIIGDDDDEDI